MTSITWLGHGSWLIECDNHRILLDPFLSDNPSATAKPDDFFDCHHILISHGHFDHVADAAQIAKNSNATVIAIHEIAQWFAEQHQIEQTIGMNLGGQVTLPFGTLKMVPAVHSSQLPDGSSGGVAAGFVLTTGGRRIYFACDTAYFGDMAHYAGGVDLAVLPIGDLFTMGIEESIAAIQTIQPTQVLPAHYNTWPPITVDVEMWTKKVREETEAEPIVLPVGGSVQLDSTLAK
ncbi:metal-dependent hydrolase [bacterium]|nr:metal-dependent hydrolase [bacterium]